MQPSKPETWTAPLWHPDFGDPTKELRKLRTVSSGILEKTRGIQVRLNCAEEGYMSVEVTKDQTMIAEIHIVNSDCEKQLYGVFVETGDADDEVYFEDFNEVVRHISRIAI